MMDKKGAFVDLFLFMIFSLIIILICGIFIYIGGQVNTKLHETMDTKMFGDVNGSDLVTETIGKVNTSYQALYWISWFLIVGMILSIFIGSYMVTTKPVFFIPYLFVTIIAVIMSATISNAYEDISADPTLASTFAGFVGANFIMSQLPIVVTVIGFAGAVIMFSRMGSRENQVYGGYYG